jgi:NAD(P)-dependent dehydrogenase (short-subunit alcohol dehydrogenase family)
VVAFAQRRDRPVALVTGATGGIGFFTAAGLAQRGWAVVVTGRDEGRGEEAVGQLRRRAGHDDVSFVAVDHSVVGENTGLAARLVREVGALDVVVNNVGGIYAKRWESADGYEATLAMNFVGPVAFTLGLRRRCGARRAGASTLCRARSRWLRATRSRICRTSAANVGINAYARAKLLNVLWMRALAGREPGITVNAVNPGMAWTPSTQALTPAAVPAWRFVWPLVRWFQRRASAEKAAATLVRVCVGEIEAQSGTYVDDNGKPGALPDTASDPAILARVWSLGESLVTPTDQPATRPRQQGRE